MPYITQRDRDILEQMPYDPTKVGGGGINYLFSSLMDEWLEANGVSYQSINTLIGVLECAKMELYRRVAVPYEDKKIRENGDVYTV